MIGGLGAAIKLENTNGRCFINASLNSLMNSFEIVKYLHMRNAETSINSQFSEIVSSSENIMLDLLSAYTHDYILDKQMLDLDKFMFVIKNLEKIVSFTNTKKLHKFLDTEYSSFSHFKLFRTDFFIGLGLYPTVKCEGIQFRLIKQLQRTLSEHLRDTHDIYIIVSMPDTIDDSDDLTLDDMKCIKTLYKLAMTSTSEYVCTDILCYEADESGFGHVVYHNLMDETLTDDQHKMDRYLRELSHDDDYIYIPFILHFQKLHNDLNLDGTFKTYNKSYDKRIALIKEQLSSYTESWYQNKVKRYLEELENGISDDSTV